MFVKNLKMHLHLYFSYTVLYFQSQYFFIKTDNTYFNDILMILRIQCGYTLFVIHTVKQISFKSSIQYSQMYVCMYIIFFAI